ncbi:hypothetical protein G9X53_03235 [Cronobacter dublinensis]|uniref:hypothetical protein n=1 Tax=Cronobacter dublinensis TaxID=413497 RepID=UPI001412AB5B|nr:hypothetical protein [Cronobacter dublinensis]NHV88351.1 hypothetical protein [Cronobacter dublinensis]
MAIHKIIAIIFIGQGLNKAMQAILPVISNSPDKISKKCSINVFYMAETCLLKLLLNERLQELLLLQQPCLAM